MQVSIEWKWWSVSKAVWYWTQEPYKHTLWVWLACSESFSWCFNLFSIYNIISVICYTFQWRFRKRRHFANYGTLLTTRFACVLKHKKSLFITVLLIWSKFETSFPIMWTPPLFLLQFQPFANWFIHPNDSQMTLSLRTYAETTLSNFR